MRISHCAQRRCSHRVHEYVRSSVSRSARSCYRRRWRVWMMSMDIRGHNKSILGHEHNSAQKSSRQRESVRSSAVSEHIAARMLLQRRSK